MKQHFLLCSSFLLALNWSLMFVDSIATITCKFTGDNGIDSIYLDGSDVTSSVTGLYGLSYDGDLDIWEDVKVHTFPEPKETYTSGVMYAFKIYEAGETASPEASGFLLKCTSSAEEGPWHNLVSAVDSRWSGFASTTLTDSASVNMLTPTIGDAFPINWYDPSVNENTTTICESTSGFECDDPGCSSKTSGATKIWVTDDGSTVMYKYAVLRVFVLPTISPSQTPTTSPTQELTVSPTTAPSKSPSVSPTNTPTKHPSKTPTNTPSFNPTSKPTTKPSLAPTNSPSFSPLAAPTIAPTFSPTSSCGGKSKNACNKMAYCKWKRVDEKKECVPYDCTQLNKKQCGEKKKGVCLWDKNANKCIQINV